MKELGKAIITPFSAPYVTVGPASPLKPAELAGMAELPTVSPPLPLPPELFMGMDQLYRHFLSHRAVQVMKDLHGGEEK